MRVTNNMTMSKMLLNINKNSNLIDKLYTQYTTGKKIQNASDDPIIASRALKFRTSISQTTQFQRNADQGISWMGITEQGFENTIDILATIRERCNQAATGTLEYTDRQKIISEIQTLFEQIGAEMNIQYAGRYVFSGYRTDEPPTMTEDDQTANFSIQQILSQVDIEKVNQYSKAGSADEPIVEECYRIKLPYNTGISSVTLHTVDASGNLTLMGTPTEISKDDPSAYKPAAGQAHYIKETGEIILSEEIVTAYNASSPGGIGITYNKVGLSKGELNPKVYFTCTDNTSGLQYTMDNQDLKFEFSTNTTIKINNLAKDVLTPAMYADLKLLCDEINSIEISTDAALQEKYSNPPYDTLTEEERTDAINEQISNETKLYNGVMQSMFSNMLSILDKHNSNISTEETNLGSRMVRLDLINDRLKSDQLNYTDLMSDNENVDYLEVLMNLKTAESVYQAALKAGGSIMQLSLADFI